MTKNASMKKAVRALMAEQGITYVHALRIYKEQQEAKPKACSAGSS